MAGPAVQAPQQVLVVNKLKLFEEALNVGLLKYVLHKSIKLWIILNVIYTSI
jgi:hypothetical protein